MSESQAIAELEAALALQSAAFLRDQSPSVETRIGYLHKLAGMMMANREEIRVAMNADFGSHPEGCSDVIECLGIAGRAMFAAGRLPEWAKDVPEDVDPALYGNGTAVTHSEPKGVVLNLSAWNFPSDLSLGPLVEILAAGNRAILKPSELAPACGLLIQKMVRATFERDLVDVVLGGAPVAIAATQMKFNHILYTGSPNIGKLVMAAAAKNLVPVTLELGGRCPVIVSPGSVNAKTIESIIGTKQLKNGQMCVTTNHVFVPRKEMDAFVALCHERYASGGLSNYSTSSECCGIIAERHLKRIVDMVAEAKTSGAKVIDLEANTAVDPVTRRMPLVLVVDPPKNIAVSTEEIFGPILPLHAYDTLEDVVAEINAGERPLGLYVYSADKKTIDYVIANTKSGGVSINAAAIQAALPSLGFGGVGNSGTGRHHGKAGFNEFSNPRGIFTRGDQPDLIAALYPPYATALAVADHAFAAASAPAAQA